MSLDPQTQIESLAVVEVPESNKVRCQAPGCSKSIWKAVHVVRIDGQLQVIGSSCFKKLFLNMPAGVGTFTGASVRKLTAEERQQLIDNTEALVALLKEEFNVRETQRKEAERQQQAAIAAAVEVRHKPLPSPAEGPARTVICHYCKKPMTTTFPFTPGLGFKCTVCKENNVPLPSRQGRSYAPPVSSYRPVKTPEQLAKEKASEDYRKAKGK